MNAEPVTQPQADIVLAKAVRNVAPVLGLTQRELGRIIGRDRSRIASGIDPDSKSGELALCLVRCHRALFALMGGDAAQMRHWFTTHNLHTGGVPAQQVQDVAGLIRVMEYLDAMRGRA